MTDKTDSLLAELYEILGVTVEDAVEMELPKLEPMGSGETKVFVPPVEWIKKHNALPDTYRNIWQLLRRELQSAYDRLFQLVGEAGAPVEYITEVLADEDKVPSRDKRLFATAKAQFDELLSARGFEFEGESCVPAGELVKILANVIRPPWWRPGYGSLLDLNGNLETILRLTRPFRNAIVWAIGNGHEPDKQTHINAHVSILRSSHGWYERAFAPEVRGRILHKEYSYRPIAALILDPSQSSGCRVLQTVAAATRLESPAREVAVAVLAFALKIDVLHSELVSIYAKLWVLKPKQLLEQLFPGDLAERLNGWMATVEAANPRIQTEALRYMDGAPPLNSKPELADLAERVNNLESIVLPGERAKTERWERLAGLVKNILDFLHEETAHPRCRWLGESYDVVGNYCELLWENAVDEALGVGYSGPDKYEEWQWLELRRSITELALGFREGRLFSYGWKT